MEIDFQEFLKLEMKVGIIRGCDVIPNSKNLYKLMIDCGENCNRQIVSGISKFYTSEELIDQKIVVLTNLKPRKIMGIESRGMILAADVNGEPFLLKIDENKRDFVPPGSKIK